ncbi:GTPase HflX [compost metagenome]
MNKIDAAPELLEQGPRLERDEDGIPTRVFLSAREGMGLDALREAVVEVAQWLASRPPEPQPYDPRLADVPQYADAGDDGSADEGGVADGSDDADAGDSDRL